MNHNDSLQNTAEMVTAAIFTTAPPRPFTIDLTKPFHEVLFGPGAKIVHPCDLFAHSAGYDSWAAAFAAMQEGKVVAGTAPGVGRMTMYGFQLFLDEVMRHGMVSYMPEHNDFGVVFVGKRESFPAEKLAKQEARAVARAERFFASLDPSRQSGDAVTTSDPDGE
jgi:hypothetical protein